jgi:UDP-N-acetylglucosamine transferase subunit ALG13
MTTALVCTGGGHLKELWLLRDRLGIDLDDVIWVTFDTGLSRSLLRGQPWVPIPYVPPRDLGAVARLVPEARRIVRRHTIDRVITTGAQVAVAFLPPLVTKRLDYHFIESATRLTAPSVSARIASAWPATRLYSQSPRWQDRRWKYRGSVFDGWKPLATRRQAEVMRVVVTVGTMEKYGFRRLFERLSQIMPDDVTVLWQTGATDVSGLGIEGRVQVDAHELDQEMAAADVVVCHAGVGSTLQLLEAGRVPVVVPRLRRFGEHVDDHQVDLADTLEQLGLGVRADASEITWAQLVDAAGRSVERLREPPSFILS